MSERPNCAQQAAEGMRYRMARDLWFAKMCSVTRMGGTFTEPEPKIEDFVSATLPPAPQGVE